MFCKNKMPDRSNYKIVGLDEGSLDRRRAAYYLYPDLEAGSPAYILDAQKYVLKKTSED